MCVSFCLLLFFCLLSSVLCFVSFFGQFLIKSELVLFKTRHGLMKGPTRGVFYTNTIRQRLHILLYARIFVRFCFELYCCCRFLWQLLHTLFFSVTPCSPSSQKTSVQFVFSFSKSLSPTGILHLVRKGLQALAISTVSYCQKLALCVNWELSLRK